VHPQKLEVRFVDARAVQDALQAAISRALKAAPWRTRNDAVPQQLEGAFYAQAVERFLSRVQEPAPFLEAQPQGFGQGRPGLNEAPPPGYFTSLRFIGELAKRLWVCEAPGGTLVVIDPHAVRERLHLHRLATGAETAQRTLFSAAVELTPSELARLVDLHAVLERLGIEAEPFGATTIAVKALPIESRNPAELIRELLSVLPDEAAALKVLAHHAASADRSASAGEAQTLLAALDDVDFDIACLHGKVVVHEVPLLQLVAE
jgi:DNA mismatch repair protein MutL